MPAVSPDSPSPTLKSPQVLPALHYATSPQHTTPHPLRLPALHNTSQTTLHHTTLHHTTLHHTTPHHTTLHHTTPHHTTLHYHYTTLHYTSYIHPTNMVEHRHSNDCLGCFGLCDQGSYYNGISFTLKTGVLNNIIIIT